MGTGEIDRISSVINQQTQSVDVYFNILPAKGKKVYSGQYLNVGIDQETIARSMTVPRMAVTENKVALLKDSTIHYQSIQVIGSKPDSLYVAGLKDGLQLVLDKVEIDTAGINFKGIIR